MPEEATLLTPPAGTPPVVPPAGTPPAGETPPAGTPPVVPPAGETPEAVAAAAAAQKAIDDAKAVPETYEFKMPDGIQLDTAAATEFGAIAKELKLSQADAQRVAEVGAKMAQRQQEQHTKQVASWVEAITADKDIGGDKLPENMAIAQRAVKTYGSPELLDVLAQSGFGNHPAFVKAFYKIGLTLKPDSIEQGGNVTQPRTVEEILYPKRN